MTENLKLANSYGNIAKISNSSRQRKPYVVPVTTSYVRNAETDEIIQKYGIISYTKTREKGR